MKKYNVEVRAMDSILVEAGNKTEAENMARDEFMTAHPDFIVAKVIARKVQKDDEESVGNQIPTLMSE